MPSDATEILQFFESLEAMFRLFEIPADLHAKLLLPFLSLKAKSLISCLNAEELEDYEGVRDFLLSEFKLTPREYKARFDNATTIFPFEKRSRPCRCHSLSSPTLHTM